MMVAVAGAQHNIDCTELGKQGTVVGNRHTRFPSCSCGRYPARHTSSFLLASINSFLHGDPREFRHRRELIQFSSLV